MPKTSLQEPPRRCEATRWKGSPLPQFRTPPYTGSPAGAGPSLTISALSGMMSDLRGPSVTDSLVAAGVAAAGEGTAGAVQATITASDARATRPRTNHLVRITFQ